MTSDRERGQREPDEVNPLKVAVGQAKKDLALLLRASKRREPDEVGVTDEQLGPPIERPPVEIEPDEVEDTWCYCDQPDDPTINKNCVCYDKGYQRGKREATERAANALVRVRGRLAFLCPGSGDDVSLVEVEHILDEEVAAIRRGEDGE